MTSEQIYGIYHYLRLPDPVARTLLGAKYGKSWEGIFTIPTKHNCWLNALPGFAVFPFQAGIFSLHQDSTR